MFKKAMFSFFPVSVLVVLIVTLSLFTTGCLVNPTTGRPGPSWQVPLRIPLIATEITVTDLMEQADFAGESSVDGGFQAEFRSENSFDFQDVQVSFSPVVIDVDAIDITPGIINEFSFTTQINLTDFWEDGILEEVTFSSGNLTIDLNSGANATITAISLDNKKQDENSLSLAGLTMADKAELTIEGNLSSDVIHNIQSVTVALNAGTDNIAAITGRSLKFKIPIQSIDLDFDAPDDPNNIEFSNIELSLAVKYKSTNNNDPVVDLTGLKISGLTMPETAVFKGNTVITFDSAEATNLLNSPPDTITINGDVKIGDLSSTMSFDDSLELEFNIIVPFEFELLHDIVYESEVFSVDASEASLDGIQDFTNSFHGELDLEYRMPLGAKVDLYLSNSDTPLLDSDAIHVKIAIDSAPTSNRGRTTDANRQKIPVKLPEGTRDVLQEKTYAQVKITIPAEENKIISFSEQDYAIVMAWIELMINVNK